MKQRESQFAITLRHWLKANPRITCSIETKQTTKDYISFSEVKQPQIDWGLAIKSNKGILIRTQAIVEGMPDYIYMRSQPAYVAIKYPSGFVLIDIETFLLEKEKTKRKSLTWSRAKEIAIKTVKNK